jgi:chloramphenicol O-acetyltransferase
MIARLRIVDGYKIIWYIYSILYTIYETFSAIDANSEQDFSKFLSSPPHPGERGKMWAHPTPRQGVAAP